MSYDDGSPVFANGTEYEAWRAGWCAVCAHEPTCPDLTHALLTGEQPTSWRDNRRAALGPARFDCTRFDCPDGR